MQPNTSMLIKLSHYLISKPLIYDLVQYCVGAHYIHKRLSRQVNQYISDTVLLDIGGGTGISKKFLISPKLYICLDIDKAKLDRFSEKSAGIALLGDATFTPVKKEVIDVVLCAFMTHHLSDRSFVQLLVEIKRILKTNGTLILIDAILDERATLGRMLWKFDVGIYPKTRGALISEISKQFYVINEDAFDVFHQYHIITARK